MIEKLNDYDWEQAFGFANFTREDVAEIIADSEGCNDDDPWLSFGKLADGRYYFLSAWCDYTGWDCQSGGDGFTHTDKEQLQRFNMSDEERKRLGIVLPHIDSIKPITNGND